MKKIKPRHILFAVYCIAMAVLLFARPRPADGDYLQKVRENINFIPFHTVGNYLNVLKYDTGEATNSHALINLLGNILLFIPLGAFMPLVHKKLRTYGRTLLACLLLIVIIEIAQLFTLRGSCDIDDLILNMLGVALGYPTALLIHKNK